MRAGPFGVAIPPWIDGLRNPAGPAPPAFRTWRFQFCSPPYRSLGKPVQADERAEAGMRVGPGAFLLADAGVPYPDEVPLDLTWIQATVPWCGVVLQVELAQREAVEELVRRMARRGITVVPREDSDPASVARLIVRTTDPVGEVEGSLRAMLPRMDAGARAEAAAQIQAGLRAAFDPEGPAGVRAGQDRRIFFRVGRALGAAVRLQRAERGTSNLSVAYQAGYASASSLETSLKTDPREAPWSRPRHRGVEVAPLARAAPGGGEAQAATRAGAEVWLRVGPAERLHRSPGFRGDRSRSGGGNRATLGWNL